MPVSPRRVPPWKRCPDAAQATGSGARNATGFSRSKRGRPSSWPSLKRSGRRKYITWSRQASGLGWTDPRGARLAWRSSVGASASTIVLPVMIAENYYTSVNDFCVIRFETDVKVHAEPSWRFAERTAHREVVSLQSNRKPLRLALAPTRDFALCDALRQEEVTWPWSPSSIVVDERRCVRPEVASGAAVNGGGRSGLNVSEHSEPVLTQPGLAASGQTFIFFSTLMTTARNFHPDAIQHSRSWLELADYK